MTGTFRNVASLLFHVILDYGRIKLPELPSLHSRGIGVDTHSFQSKFEGVSATKLNTCPFMSVYYLFSWWIHVVMLLTFCLCLSPIRVQFADQMTSWPCVLCDNSYAQENARVYLNQVRIGIFIWGQQIALSGDLIRGSGMAPNDTKRPQCGVIPKQEKSEKKEEQGRKDPELPHDYRWTQLDIQ